MSETALPVTEPRTLPTPEQGLSVKIKLPVTMSLFCRREPDCVIEALVSAVSVRPMSQLPEIEPVDPVDAVLLVPHALIHSNHANHKIAIFRCIKFALLRCGLKLVERLHIIDLISPKFFGWVNRASQ